jgi:hypothetical protein
MAKILGHLSERHHPHAGVCQHVIDEPLEHHQDMRLARAVRMNRDRKDRVVVVAIYPVELILPDLALES